MRIPFSRRRVGGSQQDHEEYSAVPATPDKRSRRFLHNPTTAGGRINYCQLSTYIIFFLLLALLANIEEAKRFLKEQQQYDFVDETSPSPNKEAKEVKLRLDWSNVPPQSAWAKKLQDHQNDCNLPLGDFRFRNQYGLGSDLHLYGQGVCNAMQYGVRLRTAAPWIFMDEEQCQDYVDMPMKCYFSKAELNCPGDVDFIRQHPNHTESQVLQAVSKPNGRFGYNCSAVLPDLERNEESRRAFRKSSIEWLFSHISPIVIEEAKRQAKLVFANKTGAGTTIPSNLITVHIRWGDKHREMQLVNEKTYVMAVKSLLVKRLQKKKEGTNQKNPREDDEEVNIYLATEDPAAVQAFRKEAPDEWNIYLDHYYTEMLPHRIDEYNGSPKTSKLLKGRTGLVAMGSLLVAMEANDYVLTTASNWSRLMNELREMIVDPRCNGCTSMIDLRAVTNEW